MKIKNIFLFLAIYVLPNPLFSFSSGGELSKDQNSFDVTFYDIDIKIDPNKKILSGEVIISLILYQQVKKIELDLINKYSVSGVSINEQA